MPAAEERAAIERALRHFKMDLAAGGDGSRRQKKAERGTTARQQTMTWTHRPPSG